MSYYADLFLRPKQAVNYALANPSLVRSLGFVLLGTVASILTMLLFMGTIFWDAVVSFLLGDVARWLVSGFALILMGFVFKRIPFTMVNISRVLSTLAQLNVYGFFMFLVLGLLLPAIAIPDLISATNDLSAGNIGEDEFALILDQSLNSASDAAILALPLLLLGVLFIFYIVYVLFLSIQKYLDTSVFKAVLVWLILVSLNFVWLSFLG